MKRIHIKDIKDHESKKVTIAGFVQTKRNQGSITFLLVRDASGIAQVVITKDNSEAMKTAQRVSLESIVEVTGISKKEKQAPGGIEVAAENITVLSSALPELPIPVVEKGGIEADQSIRLDWRFLDLRKPKNAFVFKIFTTLEVAFREYWTENGYVEIHSPKLIGAPSESGAEVFEVKYFDRKAYLAQSPQFYKQMAMAAGFEKVFEVGPVFRAEPSFTSRHATEFTGYDAEIAYISSHHEVMAELERIVAFAIKKVKEAHGADIKSQFEREVVVPKIPFPKISMKETKKILSKLNVPSEKEGDISPEEERKICEHVLKQEGHEFVFITEYPVSARPFYHMRDESDRTLTKSFDLLWSGIEITTGAQREHRYDTLVLQAKEKKMRIEEIEFYLNFFKYGCPPHGGYGMGPNRFLMKLLNLDNVREAMFLYRGVKRLLP